MLGVVLGVELEGADVSLDDLVTSSAAFELVTGRIEVEATPFEPHNLSIRAAFPSFEYPDILRSLQRAFS